MKEDYELVRQFHQEGDNVNLFRHLPTQELVVIKKLPVTDDSAYKEMHINHVLQKQSHRGIVRLLDEYVVENDLYLVFEYCSGGDLLSKLMELSKGSWSEEDVVPIFEQVVQAIAFLHSMDIAHCDISLENILLSSNLQVKLCDFGLALFQTPTRYFGVGKLYYMSPEMHLRRTYNVQAGDRWALGILLFMLLTGRSLFEKAVMTDTNFKTFFEAQAIDPDSGVKAVVEATKAILSDSAIDLITQLLRPSPRDRISMDQVLSHSFFQRNPASSQNHRRQRSVSSPVTRLSSFPQPAIAQIPVAYLKSITTL